MYDLKQSIKEIIRHATFRCGLAGAHDLYRRWQGRSDAHMRLNEKSSIFSKIYEDNVWVEQDGQDSVSGTGSTRIATTYLTSELTEFLDRVKCRKLVDIGCGDYNWMRYVSGSFDYIGIDVVPQLIASHQVKYADSKHQFLCMDATKDKIPNGDVAVCREVLFHLSFHDGLQLLQNIRSAGFRYVLLTHDVTIWFNSDIRTGDFRIINFRKAPYRLPEPLYKLKDDEMANCRTLAVWTGEALPG